MSGAGEGLFVQFSDCGQHIRKWSREPFDGALVYREEATDDHQADLSCVDDHQPTSPVERLARELFAQHANRPDRAETLRTILDELGLDVVKREEQP